MEEIKGYVRNVKCEVCKNLLASIYIRSNKKFKSLKNYHYCENCSKIYKIENDEKNGKN